MTRHDGRSAGPKVRGHEAAHGVDPVPIERRERFVEKPERSAAVLEAGERDAPPLPRGETTAGKIGEGLHVEPNRWIGLTPTGGPHQKLPVVEVLLGSQHGLDAFKMAEERHLRAVGGGPFLDAAAVPANRPFFAPSEPRKDPKERALARSVGSDDMGKRTRRNNEIDASRKETPPTTQDEPIDLEHTQPTRGWVRIHPPITVPGCETSGTRSRGWQKHRAILPDPTRRRRGVGRFNRAARRPRPEFRPRFAPP